MLPADALTPSLLADALAASDPPALNMQDELRDARGRPRERWQRFFSWFDGDANELDRRAAGIARQIRHDGVTHNVYVDGAAAARPWPLELLPMLVEPADWARIERGVAQRAQLFDAMLSDVYGPQSLLREALLPPTLIYRHAGYLRPLAGSRPPGGLWLHICAFDLARGPDGSWWVVSQRTQSPSGLGYVLHNRLIVSRAFPEAFREMRVQHLASGYRRLLDTVFAQAAEIAGSATPRVVLLTPGPYTETYFEHAYLARYLGLPLVEGADLLVRDERLYLKTVEGLEPVHGVLRRLDDDWCDPLELRADSTLGVTGLLQAVRAGRVVMANAIGSGWLESSAVQGFLPAISRRLLGEELALPTLATWWCGEPAAWRQVQPQMAGMVARPVFGRGRGAELLPRADGALAAWRQTVDADPEAWALQERLKPSQAPVWVHGRFDARPATLRVYAIADPQRRWHVLPGGMTRVSPAGQFQINMQSGGSSLDTWVMTDGPVDLYSMLPRRLTVDDIAERRRPVASRTGENLYWLGRYTERSEQLVRLARATLNLIDADADAPPELQQAVATVAERAGLVPQGVPSLVRAPQVFERALLADLPRTDGAWSIGFNLAALLRAAQALRERLSPLQARLVRTMADEFAERIAPPDGQELPSAPQVLAALDGLATQLAAVTGVQTDRMTRDHGWRLLTVGRLTERLIAVTRNLYAMVDARAHGTSVGVDLMLELFDSAITFRARYQQHDELLALIDLLVLDSANPRAFAGVLRRLRTEIGKLPGDTASRDALLSLLPREGAGVSLDQLRGLDDEALRERLMAVADCLTDAAFAMSDEVGRRYFAHADVADRLVRA